MGSPGLNKPVTEYIALCSGRTLQRHCAQRRQLQCTVVRGRWIRVLSIEVPGLANRIEALAYTHGRTYASCTAAVQAQDGFGITCFEGMRQPHLCDKIGSGEGADPVVSLSY